jgi:ABC-type branched-subunit amino acid transport system permease subunit
MKGSGMNYRNLKTHEVEAFIWGLTAAIMLTLGGTPPTFAVVVGIIFFVVAVYVLDTKRQGKSTCS